MSESVPIDESSLQKENQALKRKIDELERTLSEVAFHDAQPVNKTGATSWTEQALFASIILLSAVSVYLVVMDRWFENRIHISAVDELWWSILPLRELGYPRYFLIIFSAVVLVTTGIILWRKVPLLAFSNLSLGKQGSPSNQVSIEQFRTGKYLLLGAIALINISVGFMLLKGRIPGWELLLALALYVSGRVLKEYPIEGFKQYFQEKRQFLVSAAIFILTLCGLLYNMFGESSPNFASFLLFALACALLFRHKKEVPSIFWVSVASLVALTWNLNGWEYVVIGDEYSFYNEVRNILENRSAWEILNNTFNGNFVYGTHPYFSSYIHYFFMKLFGNHNFGWRFSNPFLVASSLFFYYYFFRTFILRRTAFMTVIFLGISHYLLSFSKIGYNNLQAFFALGLVLAAFAWTLKSMNPVSFSLLGLSTGICLYLYPAALYIIPLPFLGLLVFYPPDTKEAIKHWGLTIVSFGLLFYPLIIQPEYWEAKIAGTFFYTDASSSAIALLKNVSINSLYTSFSFLYIPEQTHFVSTGYMDPVSSIFIVIGFVSLILLVFRKNKSALFLALSFLWMFFIVGSTHGRNYPTATRMFLLLPWFALFAAFGVEWCAERAAHLYRAKRTSFLILVTSLIVITNLFHAYRIDVQNMAQYHSLAPLFIKTVREIDSNARTPPKSYAFVGTPDWDTSGLAMIQRAYLVPDSPRQLIDLPLEGDRLPESAIDLASQRDVVTIVRAGIDDRIVTEVEAQLQSLEKSMCEVRNEKGVLQFQLWHAGDLAWLCP